MIRITKHADYGIVLLAHMARGEGDAVHNARDLARTSGLPQPMVGKILTELARARILRSHRGVRGGYSLAGDPRDLSLARVITALEGPIALMDCSPEGGEPCVHERNCVVRTPWARINDVVQGALESVTLADLVYGDAARTQLTEESA